MQCHRRSRSPTRGAPTRHSLALVNSFRCLDCGCATAICMAIAFVAIEIQINAASLEALDCPGHHNVEFAPACVVQHGVEARPAVSALGAADSGVAVNLDNLPAAAL